MKLSSCSRKLESLRVILFPLSSSLVASIQANVPSRAFGQRKSIYLYLSVPVSIDTPFSIIVLRLFQSWSSSPRLDSPSLSFPEVFLFTFQTHAHYDCACLTDEVSQFASRLSSGRWRCRISHSGKSMSPQVPEQVCWMGWKNPMSLRRLRQFAACPPLARHLVGHPCSTAANLWAGTGALSSSYSRCLPGRLRRRGWELRRQGRGLALGLCSRPSAR